MTPDQLPAFFGSADEHAERWQSRFFLFQRLQLAGLVTAAVGGASSFSVSGGNASATVAALGFVVALLARLAHYHERPEQNWYDGRAAAESVKTLSWRFAVGGKPFEKQLDDDAAIHEFSSRIIELTRNLPSLDQPAGDSAQVSAAMVANRSQTLMERVELYDQERLLNQQQWYSSKAGYNRRRSDVWNRGLIVLDVVAVTAAIFRVAGWIDFDLLGVVATLSAVSVAWLQSRQHDLLARSYSVASQELAAIRLRLRQVTSEQEWADVIDGAEEAISREHTLWQDTRTVL